MAQQLEEQQPMKHLMKMGTLSRLAQQPQPLPKLVVDTPVLKTKQITRPYSVLVGSLVLLACSLGCQKAQKSSNRTSTMDAIVDGSFATDKAMQEERTEQGSYIQEQEERYEE